MATSIINYYGKNLDIDDNVLQLSLYFIKESFEKNIHKPTWVIKYQNEVIDSMLSIQPTGWGYMDLEEFLTSKNEKDFFISIIDSCINDLKNRKSKIIDYTEVNKILNLKGIEKWNEKHYVEVTQIIFFLENVKILIDDSTGLNHPNLMKTRPFGLSINERKNNEY